MDKYHEMKLELFQDNNNNKNENRREKKKEKIDIEPFYHS